MGRLETERERPFNAALFHVHRELVRHRFILLASSIAAYAAAVIFLAPSLAISTNYFVIIPLIAAALGFGSPGAIVAGALGLPANLLLFQIVGHPEFSPASKVIAELSGLTLGAALGLLSDYFAEVGLEIRRRERLEESLRDALTAKELLLRELQHRVKNNLNVIKSLVMLQRSRSSDPAFIEASDELNNRIFAMATVHDGLFGNQGSGSIDLEGYLRSLIRDISSTLGIDESRITLNMDARGRELAADAAMPLGLIVNEVLMNASKHARTESNPNPSIAIRLRAKGSEYSLTIEDDGPGPDDRQSPAGLGNKIVRALAENLGGSASLSPIMEAGSIAGARFELSWPEAAPASQAGGAKNDAGLL